MLSVLAELKRKLILRNTCNHLAPARTDGNAAFRQFVPGHQVDVDRPALSNSLW